MQHCHKSLNAIAQPHTGKALLTVAAFALGIGGSGFTPASAQASSFTTPFERAGEYRLIQDNVETTRVWISARPGNGTAILNKISQMKVQGQDRVQVHHFFENLDAIAVTLPTALIETLNEDDQVDFIEEDQKRYRNVQTEQLTPWGIDAIEARDVWSPNQDGNIDLAQPNGTGITVCIIDSGIHAKHEDLRDLTLDGEDGVQWGVDTCGHGTHVAGTIAAANNDYGVVGVTPGTSNLFIVKVFDGTRCEWTYSSALVHAATQCIASGNANIINMSLGGPSRSRIEDRVFSKLYDQGVLMVAAAGNGHQTGEIHSYPASYDSVISVAAIDKTLEVADFSQRNPKVELAAPGVEVISTVPWLNSNDSVIPNRFTAEIRRFESGTNTLLNNSTGGYESWDGTSMAAPHVAGAAALIWSAKPSWTNAQIREALTKTAKDIDQEGEDVATGYGLIQTKDALDFLIEIDSSVQRLHTAPNQNIHKNDR